MGRVSPSLLIRINVQIIDNPGYGNLTDGVTDGEGDGEVGVADAAGEGGWGAISRGEGRLGYRFVKRAFDIAFSACVVAILLVPGALLCLAVRFESPGSPIHRRACVGKGGKEFPMYKFRTMVADADDVEKHLDEGQLEQWRRECKVDDDPRVTRLGKAMRKASIDEFPQFLNVLKGEMSVVGPRPVTRGELAAYGALAPKLLSVKPGITGPFQTIARDDTDYSAGRRQRLQLDYVDNRSLREDAKVLALTVTAIFKRTGE